MNVKPYMILQYVDHTLTCLTVCAAALLVCTRRGAESDHGPPVRCACELCARAGAVELDVSRCRTGVRSRKFVSGRVPPCGVDFVLGYVLAPVPRACYRCEMKQ